MNSTDIEKMSTCFKNNNFNHQDVGRMVAFVQGVSKLFDPNTYNITVTYLEMLAKFQKDLKDQETGMVSLRVNLEKQISMNVSNPVLLLNDSLGLSNHFGAGMEVLEQMIQVQKENKTLEGPITYQPDVLAEIKRLDNKSFWQDPGSSIRSLLAGIGQLETAAASARLGKKQLMDIRSVFLAAEKVPGIDNFKDRIVPLPDRLRPRSSQPAFQTAIENLEQLSDWDLDFVKHKKTLNSAYLSLESISWYFDDIFGFTRSQSNSNNNQSQTIQHVEVHVTEPYLSFLTLLGMSLGLILFIFLVAFVAYGFTKNGRTKYRNFYLYYFPNQKEFEKRWRYSLFMDRLDGKNALLDASREVNPINTRNILNKGAYINVYNAHGNTALHMVTKRGYHEIVELLIKNGADRGAKNASNKIPEQMIAKNLSDLPQDVIADLKKVEEVYEKHRKKKYRIRVPQEFPSHLFHVYIEPRTDDTLTNSFMDKFKSIATNEPLPTATHCVVKTNADGHLETDDLNLLMWIFNGVIIVKENWMKACLDDPKAIYEDSKYLVEHVKYKGVVYKNCVLPWSQAMAKGTMPYLYGVYFVVCRYEYDNLAIIHDLIATLGGNSPQTFPIKENFELGSRPYLHTNLGPLFLLHDGQMDLTAYKNDPDNMYTLFTEEEFIAFLLKREVHQDTSDDPIPVVLDNEPIY